MKKFKHEAQLTKEALAASFLIGISFLLAGCVGTAEQAKRDQDKAQFESTKAQAEKGDPAAELALAHMYEYGTGVHRDFQMGTYWLTKAASDGDHPTQMLLGNRCMHLIPTQCDYATAFHWFQMAGDAGDSFTMGELSVMYENGLGTPKDHGLAEHWMDKATAHSADAASGYNVILNNVLMARLVVSGDAANTLKRLGHMHIDLQFRFYAGRADDVTVVQSTGSGLLDGLVVQTLQGSPLPPPPRTLDASNLDAHFDFDADELFVLQCRPWCR